MKRNVAPNPVEALADGDSAMTASAAQRDRLSVLPAPNSLIALAEELGRLMARRLLADPARRRGYSLPHLLMGALVVALVLYAIAHVLALPPR